MKLQIEHFRIESVRWSSASRLEGRTLFLDIEELKNHILEDERIQSVEIKIYRLGDKARIVNIMDVIQPRCVVGDEGVDFPGFIGPICLAGSGRRKSLQGLAVIVTNPGTNRKYSAFLDMDGKCAELSKYGKTINLCIAPVGHADVPETEFEFAVRRAGFKTAVYLAKCAGDPAPDDTEVFDLDLPSVSKEKSSLPRIAYYYQLYSPQHDHRGISDPCFYGTDISYLLPTIVHPNEVLDGGIVGHSTVRSLDTYTIQNHGVIKELFRGHGKEFIFSGMVCGVANMEPLQRKRKAMMASSLLKNVLGVDGVILTKIHGGMPHVDVAMVSEESEKLGIKTVVFVQPLVSQGSLAATSLFSSEMVDAIIVVGATQEKIEIRFSPKEIFGGTEGTHLFTPDPFTQRASDELIVTEEFLIAGVHDHTGGARVIAKEY
mgnify:FL=1